ncbi:MAG: hypothetical protein IJ022_03420 [Burkholderiaceae bacterium]|nr:hypothetical protein [Burkholderiaceae bacterium]
MMSDLKHHGIKGQRWGVRRFQKKDGSLTAAGKKRYDDDGPSEKKQKEYKIPETKSTHRLKLEEKYKSQGMTNQQAEQAAARRIRGEQYVAIAATVTVAACVAYAKHKGYTTDKTLSADTDFHRIMRLHENAEIRGGSQFMSYKKSDQTKYKGALAKELQKQAKASGEKIYDVSVKAKQDIKIASPKRAQETFEKLYKNDPAFKRSMSDLGWAGDAFNPKFTKVSQKLATGAELSKSDMKKAYELFNVALVDRTPDGQKRANKFYKALKDQGMNALYDMNDKKYSGFNAKAPIITFDGKYDYIKRELGKEEISKNANVSTAMMLTPTAIKAGVAFVSLYKGNKWLDDKAIERYKKEHPNTELTDKEIKKMLNSNK